MFLSGPSPMIGRRALEGAVLALLVSASSTASAQPAADAGNEPRQERGPAPPARAPTPAVRSDLRPSDKRRAQDYAGRAAKTTPAEALLWVPRVLFFPAYLVTEYVVRKPLGAATVAVEQNDVISKVTHAFTFGPHDNVGLVPTAFVDFGFRPSVGLYHFYDDFLAPHNDLRATVATGGAQYLKASVADRIPLVVDRSDTTRAYLQLELDGLARPDLKFWGIGPSSLSHDVGRYQMRTVGGGARAHADFWKGTFAETWVTGRRVAFSDGECDPVASIDVRPATTSCAATTLLEQVRVGRYPVPAGFTKGYGVLKVGARVVLDSRAPRPYPGSGVALDARVEHATVPSGEVHGSFLSYGASFGAFADLTGTRRVLGLVVDARFQTKLQRSFQIPFTELVGSQRLDYVPEDDLLRGFLPGRLLGSSSLTAALDYEWPIWAFLDGTMQAAVGNVFGDHLEDFRFDRLRFSFVGGITSPNHRDHQFNLMLGFGTKTFEEGGGPESLRFLLGGTTGF